jgi:hypothetical protein
LETPEAAGEEAELVVFALEVAGFELEVAGLELLVGFTTETGVKEVCVTLLTFVVAEEQANNQQGFRSWLVSNSLVTAA